MKRFRNRILVKLTALLVACVLMTSLVIGATTYTLAKNQLIDAGMLDMKHTVDAALPLLTAIQEDIENGTMSLEEGQERARLLISGPKTENGYEHSKSLFSYKSDGYMVAYTDDYATQLHPTNEIGEIPEDTTNREQFVESARKENVEDRFTFYNRFEDGAQVKKISYMTYFEPWGWHIGMTATESEFYSDIQELGYYITALTAIVSIAALLAAYLLIRKRVQTLETVATAAAAIADGDISYSNLPESNDEIGRLGRSFNKMTTQLRKLVADLQQSGINVLDRASDLSAVAEETSATAQEMLLVVNEIGSGTQDQAIQLEKTNEQVGELNQSIQSINEQKQKVVETSVESSIASVKGREMVSHLEQSHSNSHQASEDISIGITKLYGKIQDISRVTQVINGIAEQTNLLALNASIEAAQAGEHGNGFAVVAGEVRKLAKQANTRTAEIKEVISGIEQEMEKIIMLIGQTGSYSDELNEAVKQTAEVFTGIEASIQKTSGAIYIIENEIENITGQAKTMAVSIEQALSVAEETAASVEEMTASFDEQGAALETIATAAEKLTALNQQMNDDLAYYKTE